MSKVKYVDYLKEDEPIPGQNWVCISFLAPEMAKIKNSTNETYSAVPFCSTPKA